MKKLLLLTAAPLVVASMSHAQFEMSLSGSATLGEVSGYADGDTTDSARGADGDNRERDLSISLGLTQGNSTLSIGFDTLDDGFAGASFSLTHDVGSVTYTINEDDVAIEGDSFGKLVATADLDDWINAGFSTKAQYDGYLGSDSAVFSAAARKNPVYANSDSHGFAPPDAFLLSRADRFNHNQDYSIDGNHDRGLYYSAPGGTYSIALTDSNPQDGSGAETALNFGVIGSFQLNDMIGATVAYAPQATQLLSTFSFSIVDLQVGSYSYSNGESGTDEKSYSRTAFSVVANLTDDIIVSYETHGEFDARWRGIDHTQGASTTITLDAQFDAIGIHVTSMSKDGDEFRSVPSGALLGVYTGGTQTAIIATYDITDSIEVGAGFLTSEYQANATSVDGDPNSLVEVFDFGMKMSF